MSRIVLGGASFVKLDYGSTINLISRAYDNGIRMIDTAPLYSDSEEKIGASPRRFEFKISSKIGRQNGIDTNPLSVRKCFFESLRNLRVDNIDTLFFHSIPIRQIPLATLDLLYELKSQGFFNHLGYSGDGANLVDAKNLGVFDAYMFTLNPLDLENLPTARSLAPGVKIFVKRVFANGVFKFQFNEETEIILRNMVGRPKHLPHAEYQHRFQERFGSKLNLRYKDRFFLEFALGVIGLDSLVTLGISSKTHLDRAIKIETNFDSTNWGTKFNRHITTWPDHDHWGAIT